MPYPILDASRWETLEEESLGTKEKVWLVDGQKRAWLFKHPRPGTGEHWAEKVAAEIAGLLGIPHATVELARWNDRIGSVSLNFTKDRTAGSLILGNNLLSGIPGYEPAKQKPKLHSVELVLRALNLPKIRPPSGCFGMSWVRSAADAIVGYLMLDALVGNTDRHHENWGLLIQATSGGVVELAPTFDHASSLGRELDDRQRNRRLEHLDRRATVESYCAKGPSPLHSTGGRALTVRAAFERAREIQPAAASGWLRQLQDLPEARLLQAVDDLPSGIVAATARRFAKAMLDCNQRFLLSLLAS
ncbi:MAG TPA: HipA domain-containing protein [Planctomycetota bacterium]|nr:HipA domain-containing protein [Planctomycetota bacterium]